MDGRKASQLRPSEYVPGTELDFELKALYDDPNYANYDDVATYFSMRDNGRMRRQVYFKSQKPERIKRIEHEESRIGKLRKTFFEYETKKELVKTHTERRHAWRQEARKSQPANMAELDARIQLFEKIKQPPEKDADKRRLILMNEKRILTAISRLPPLGAIESDVVTKEVPPKAPGNANVAKLDYGLKACIMHFNKGKGGHTHKHKCRDVEGKFPNQKVPVHILLSDIEENPLREQCDPGKFRYFHLPTNNMAWIEKVLATYYDEKIEEGHNPLKPPHEIGPAERVLAREYWKGQMHGGSEHPVHARHMRPRCSSIPLSTTATTASAPGSPRQGQSRRPSILPTEHPNSAIFDVDSTIPEISALAFGKPSVMETALQTMQNFALFMPYLHWETNGRRAKMAQVINEELEKKKGKSKNPKTPSKGKDEKEDPLERFFRVVEQNKLKERYKHLPPARSKVLGPYLMSIAKIADEMDFEADERLLRDHLEDAPLHIRRTLDQSYFWTMEDTTSRDRDQVVFRGTKRGKTYNTRVVMVDQLWLWILDEHTILTSFPRRWGRNKPDPSGVHKSLRERLTHILDGQITSVYDIALIIIDQCSRVFFDRTKPTDQRPEVMDIFSNSIAHVTGMKTIAFDRFWRQMAIDSLNPNPKFLSSQSSSVTPSSSSASVYLNVNPEGTLLREAQDIAEELRIMARIFIQQYQVVKDFRKALEKMNEMEAPDQDPVWGSSYGGDKSSLISYKRVPKSTIMAANELLEQIQERRSEIDELGEVAKHTCQQLQDLLSLKQQQASIIEARMALVRADLSVNQGRSIMLFTIVTICFLPLSFFASIFGMNNQEMNGSTMTVHDQLTYMFPLSLLVIIASLLIAFHPVVRASLGKLKRKLFSLFGIPQSLFASLGKKTLAVLGERKNRREKHKPEIDMDNSGTQPILGQRVELSGAGNGLLKRLSRGKEENGPEARMEEFC